MMEQSLFQPRGHSLPGADSPYLLWVTVGSAWLPPKELSLQKQ